MASPSRVVSVSTGTILRTVAILLAVGVLWLIRDILLLVFTSVLLAGVMYPFARWAARRHIPKGLSVVVFYVILIGVLGVTFSLLIPALVEEARQLIATYGDGSSFGLLNDFLQAMKSAVEQNSLSENFSTSVSGFTSQLQSIFGGAVNVVTNIFGGLASLVVVFVLSLYMIVEEEAAKNLFRNVIPAEYQEVTSRIIWQVTDRLGSWLRGQLVLGLIIGVLYFIGLTVIQVPYPLLLALLAALLEFIPYLGPIIAAIPTLFLAFSVSPVRALAALVVLVVIQQLENNLIAPKVMQKVVGLNPVVSIIAFMIGAKLFGIPGAIFAIPVATAASVALGEYFKFRRHA